MKVIEVENLTKDFVVKKRATKENGKKYLFKKEKIVKHAVNDISFSVEEGEALAFIGPNGAGKSTTIKMLTGILFPTSGKVRVLGLDPIAKETLRKPIKKINRELGTTIFFTSHDIGDNENLEVNKIKD